MDSAMVNNHIFFQTKKGLLLEADKTFFKKILSNLRNIFYTRRSMYNYAKSA